MMHCIYCSALILRSRMEDVVERVLRRYESMRHPASCNAGCKEKLTKYIEMLNSAGQRNRRSLAFYGLAYLKELHEGRDQRYSGC